MSARRITKKQMKEDAFVTTILRSWEYVREHQGRFFVLLVVLVFAVALSAWYFQSRRQTQGQASDQMAEGLAAYRTGNLAAASEFFEMISERYRNNREGAHALYFLGKCALEAGRTVQAIEAFDSYIARSNRYPFFHDAALEGKAAALENDLRFAEAAEIYLELADGMKTNGFMEPEYLERAAENLKNSNQNERAIEVMERLLDKTTGIERRDLEIEIDLLKG